MEQSLFNDEELWMEKYQQKTKNWYDLFEVVSAMQKDIRRNNEEDAVFRAMELCPQYVNYMWKRLLVISTEDIADEWMCQKIRAMQQSHYFTLWRSSWWKKDRPW